MSISYTKNPSRARFVIPTTLQSDFDNFLQHDIPGYVMDLKKYRNWYKPEQAQTIRGMIYPDSTKSRYSDTDNNLNFRGSLDDDIIKGDMLQSQDGTIYLLDWQIAPQHNNKASRAVRCNAKVTFTKFANEQVDANGYLVQQQGYVTIAKQIPCNILRYEGRPQFSATSHSPGVVPNALTIVQVQFNEKTQQINIDDVFSYEKSQYVVIDIDYVGVSMNNDSGIIRLQCRKKAGGLDE